MFVVHKREDGPMPSLSAVKARQAFAETINRVAFGEERIILERHGKPVVALVPVEDLRLFERLLEEYEDRLDVKAARKALKERGEVSLKELKTKLGL